LAKFVDKKIYNVDSYSNFEVARSTAIVTTSYGIFQFNLAENNPDKMMRLPISPCADKQVCGVSIGDDGSVLISGYWGTWLGRDQDFKRIKMPQISRENGGTAISHTKEDGTYLIVSYDDADLGSLPNISPSLLSSVNSLSLEKTRFTPKADTLVVWSKVKLDNVSPLFHININGNKTFIYQVNHLDENSISKFLYYEKNSYLQLVKDAAKKNFQFTTNIGNPWWHEGIGLKKSRLKSESLPKKQIKIGIVDSGINYNHFEFSHLSDDQITSYDFVDEDEIANDVHGHGSHVSGIIAGKNYGIFPSANLVIAKALDKKGQSNSIDLARAVVWTIDQKPDLINFSWGGGFQTQVLRDAVEYGKSKGVLMLSSAGNSGSDIDKHPEIPISYGGVVAISSFTKDSKLAKHSSYGQNNVSFAFPGEDILSAHLGTTSKEMSGTSMAVAAASASFAFLSSLELPNLGFLKPQEIHNRLCKPISGYWSKYTRCGQFNLELALKELYK
jgi:hypothetical protein